MAATASSKYANLPDIDTQPDVYETSDNDSGLTAYSFLKPQDPEVGHEDIDTQRVSTEDALHKFQTATGDNAQDPASTRTRQHRAALYRNYLLHVLPNEGEFEVKGSGQAALRETPVQKLRRLLFETQELTSELQEQAADSDGSKSGNLLAQVTALQQELAHLSVGAEGSGESTSAIFQTPSGKMFLESVRKLKTPGNLSSDQEDNSSGPSKENIEAKLPSSEVAHLGTLEKRLAELEGLVGISAHDEVQSLTQEGSVLDTLCDLEDKVRLLAQPRHLESLSRRAKMLTQEFEKLTAARASRGNQEGIDDEVLDKVNRLFDTMQRVEPLIETTPAIITRLQSLQSVHLEATLVSQTLRQCSDEQTSVGEELKVLKEISERLQTSIVENTGTIEGNVQNLDERIKSLSQRIDKLAL